MCGLSIWELLEIIRTKKIPMYYTIKDAEKDIKSELMEQNGSSF